MTETIQDPRRVKPALMLILLSIVFMGPMLFAWGMYKRADNVNFVTINHGDLVLPPVPIEEVGILSIKDQTTYPSSEFSGQWSVVYLLPDHCLDGCQKNLYFLRQIHTSLGKDNYRVKNRAWFLPHQDTQFSTFIEDNYPNTLINLVNEEDFRKYLNPLVDETERVEVGAFYIIDPIGNLMMAYSGDTAPSSLKKDLKRLIKVSQIG